MFVYTAFEKRPQWFTDPEDTIRCNEFSGLAGSFGRMETMLDKGYYLAGFSSYEAGYGFEDKLSACRGQSNFPLLHFGCFKAPARCWGTLKARDADFKVSDIRPSIPFDAYQRDIETIRAHIAAGDVYQITYCLKLKFGFSGSGLSLFSTLLRRQPVPYPAYIKTGDLEILSLSPEMFIKKNGASIVTKPMKGTWPRGTGLIPDLLARFALKNDEKNRAENVMICDLLRNDLGRLGNNVRVRRLFEVSGYRTLYQMTSTVSAKIERAQPLHEIFRSLFPSGSVTGAPKITAMNIIHGLEREERKIYTGAIGYITPAREMFFNVPIRTLLLENGRGEMGVGGGIIWDSTPRGEWDESMLKSAFLYHQQDSNNAR